ncbi:MAG: hypothetical protein QG573_242 [Acidobacteriota bacterium]|nr:hypothetical protein [Acidobacteriota bacterium]
MRRISILFLVVALIYVGAGFLPGRTFAPVDLLTDFDAWKDDPAQRVRVSNSALSDVVVQFIAWDRETTRLVREGDFPWTNRFAGEGAALFANPQTAFFSPFTWPRFLLGLDGWAIAALLKLLAAALCGYWLAREMDVPARQAVVSAVVFMTSGFLVVWLLYPPANVFVFLPGLGAAALRLMKAPGRRNALRLVLLAALCTAGGHPEALFVGVVGIGSLVLWEARANPSFGWRSALTVGVSAGLGFLLLGAVLVPFFLLLADSHAAIARPDVAHSFRIWGVLGELLPGMLGSPLRGELDLTAVVGAESFHWRAAGFIGALVLLAIATAWRSLPPILRRGLVIGVIALAVSWHLPGIGAVVRHVPVLRMVALEYGLLLFVLFGAMAAGPAVSACAARARPRLGRFAIVVGGLAVVGGLVPAVPAARPALTAAAGAGLAELRERGHLQQPADVYERRLEHYLEAAGATALRRVALPGAIWFCAGWALAFATRRREIVLILAATGELVAFGAGFNPAVNATQLPLEPAIIHRVRQLDPEGQFFVAAAFEVFPANAGTLYGIRDVLSYDVLGSAERVAALRAAGFDDQAHSLAPDLSPTESERLAALGVRWVLSRSGVGNAPRLDGPAPPAVGVYEFANALARPLPANLSPAGLAAGLVVSLLAALGTWIWARSFPSSA